MTSDTLKNVNTPERLRVLLVDDDEDAYILTRHHLSKIQGQGLHLDWASTYESGIEAIRKNEHDVYLLQRTDHHAHRGESGSGCGSDETRCRGLPE